MGKLLRRRAIFVWLLPVLALIALYLTDPDKGASTGIWMIRVIVAVIAGSLAHLATKAEHDYDEADRRSLFGIIRNASDDNPGKPIGAGLALIAQAITLLAFIFLFAGQVRAQDVRTFVPPQAAQYLPALAAECQRASHPDCAIVAALIEHESGCFSMPRKCWNPKSRLKTSREEGAGFGQITRAYRGDGSLRFDALQDLRARHPALAEWSWENVYDRPDLQLRAVAIMASEGYRFFLRFVPDDWETALEFADAGYNGGNGGVQSDRRACAVSPGCNPRKWFRHVELHCTKSHAVLYGTRSACDINRHHVADVWQRASKYRGRV